jgi:hypothetical protein
MNIFEITFVARKSSADQSHQYTLRRPADDRATLESSLNAAYPVVRILSCEIIGRGYKDPCFWYQDGQRISIIDQAVFHEERGEYVGKFTGENLEEVSKHYAGAQLAEWDDAYKRMQDSYRKPPQEITKERFWDMLECLPPVGWVRHPDCESFKMSERTVGNLTGIFVRRGER